MKELMLCLLACSLAGALAGTGILLMKRLLRDKLSPNWHCYIWLLVMALLLIPIPAVELVRSEERVIASEYVSNYVPQYVPEGYTEVPLEVDNSASAELSTVPEQIPPTMETPVENLQHKTTLRLRFPSWGWKALAGIWLAGTILFFGKQLWNYQKFVSKLNHTSRAASLEMMILLKQTELEMNILRPVDLAVTSLPITPMIVGVKKPTLYMPDESLSDEQLRLIFVHELSHYKYGDLVYKELALILQGIHWFNPICRAMTDDIDFSCELCCDRRVTRFIGAERGKEYSQLLLQLLGMSFDRNTLSAAFSMDKSALKRRLSLIVKPQRTSKVLAILMAAAIGLLGAACSTVVAPSIEIPLDSQQKAELPEHGEQLEEWIAKNSDVVGWLQIPDTEINTPVVQSSDNEFYYRRDELKQYSESGSLFADYECQFGETSADLFPSTVIYGLNMSNDDDKDGERFSQLFHYADEKWAKEHPYIYFSTPEENMVWEVFAVAYTTDSNYIQILKDSKVSETEPITEEQLMNIVSTQRALSEYDYVDVQVDGDDKILTLCTNTAKGKDMRFIVMAKLVDGDKELTVAENVTPDEAEEIVLEFPLPQDVYHEVTATFGRNQAHNGVDIRANPGTNILAAEAGLVIYADFEKGTGYGNVVTIDHGNGLCTSYAHCEELLVSVDEKVEAGQAIATVGATGAATGNALHFEVLIDGENQDPSKFVDKLQKDEAADEAVIAALDEIMLCEWGPDSVLDMTAAAVSMLQLTESDNIVLSLEQYLEGMDAIKLETFSSQWLQIRDVASILLTDHKTAWLEDSGYGDADLSRYHREGLADLDEQVINTLQNCGADKDFLRQQTLNYRLRTVETLEDVIEADVKPLYNSCRYCEAGPMYCYLTITYDWLNIGFVPCVDGAQNHTDVVKEQRIHRFYKCVNCAVDKLVEETKTKYVHQAVKS